MDAAVVRCGDRDHFQGFWNAGLLDEIADVLPRLIKGYDESQAEVTTLLRRASAERNADAAELAMLREVERAARALVTTHMTSMCMQCRAVADALAILDRLRSGEKTT